MAPPPSRRTCLAPAAALAAVLALALPATASAATQTLTVQKAGTGEGLVASFPSGINCGLTCSAPFADGATVSLIAAYTNPSLAPKWSGCDSVNFENKCFVTMSGPRTVTATFDLTSHQLTVEKKGTGTGTVVSSPAGINCGSDCLQAYTHGTAVILTGTPGPNTEAVQWSGCEEVTGEGKCKMTIGGAKTVTATFESKPKLTVAKAGDGTATSSVVSSPGGISCGGSCQAIYDKGTVVTLTPSPGVHVEGALWTGCDEVTAEDKCKATMSEAKTVTATFDLEAGFAFYPLTIQRIGNGEGTVSGSPGSILCGSVCSEEFITGTEVTLTGTPAPGSAFDRWSGGGCMGTGHCTTTISGAKTVKAKFVLAGKRTLTVDKVGNGQGTVKGKGAGIDCGANCSSQIAAGRKVSLTTTAAPGSTFAGFSGACSGSKTCKVTMSEARHVVATFTAPSAQTSKPTACIVPKLRGKTVKKAKKALKRAHCRLGKVRRPKGHRKGALVVRSSTPKAGKKLGAGAKVGVKLRVAARKKR
jgi:Divergent InlB B-repeat domain/PASTA domain